MPIKINGATSGSTTIAAPDTGSDETIVLSTALASKLDATAPVGKVLQVVSTTKTDTFSASVNDGAYVDITGMTVSITPTAATSKIFVIAMLHGANSGLAMSAYRLVRGSTGICVGDAASSRTPVTAVGAIGNLTNAPSGASIAFLDSPATTSATTYKVQFAGADNSAGSNTHNLNRSNGDPDTSNQPRMASTLTVMEIAA